jgi:hypothetical protein
VRDSGSDMAMLNLTRLDFAAFRHILAYVDPNWGEWRDGYTDATRTACRPGRPHNLDGASCIALVLAWMSTTAQAKYLALVFGCTHTDVSRDLEDGIQELLAALRRCADAEIMWPTREEMNIFGLDHLSSGVRPTTTAVLSVHLDGPPAADHASKGPSSRTSSTTAGPRLRVFSAYSPSSPMAASAMPT